MFSIWRITLRAWCWCKITLRLLGDTMTWEGQDTRMEMNCGRERKKERMVLLHSGICRFLFVRRRLAKLTRTLGHAVICSLPLPEMPIAIALPLKVFHSMNLSAYNCRRSHVPTFPDRQNPSFSNMPSPVSNSIPPN